jgi:hypothetical protein
MSDTPNQHVNLTIAEPTFHVRVNHAHTLKDGWRLAETTITYDGPMPVPFDIMANLMRSAAMAGEAEAHERNNPMLLPGNLEDTDVRS